MLTLPLLRQQFVDKYGHLTPQQEKWFVELSTLINDLLGDDEDLTQYLRTDGTRALAGEWSAGSNKIIDLADGSNNGDAVNYGQLLEAGGEGIFRFIPQDTDPATEPGVNIEFMRTGDYDYTYFRMSDGTLRRRAIGYTSE